MQALEDLAVAVFGGDGFLLHDGGFELGGVFWELKWKIMWKFVGLW